MRKRIYYYLFWAIPLAFLLILGGIANADEAISLGEPFEIGEIPEDWVVDNNTVDIPLTLNAVSANSTGGWRFDNPLNRDNMTGGTGSFASADSEVSAEAMDTTLSTPPLDLSEYESVWLYFDSYYDAGDGTSDAGVDVVDSTQGTQQGIQSIKRIERGQAYEWVDISPHAAGKSNARINFSYKNNIPKNGQWQVDNAMIRCGRPPVQGQNVPDIKVTDSVPPLTDLYIPFGNVTVGSSSDQYVIVTNERGSADLDIRLIVQIDLLEEFSIISDTCSGQTISPSTESCTFTIRFSPTTTGTFKEKFDIPSNDPDESIVTVSVSGTGTEQLIPDISVDKKRISFRDTIIGDSSNEK
ncbi:MAG: choice-of-anchor D domain-containing protein, partial [Nitrospinae bacterium]|nr:choice-of-anchor D domain-containing protein [Nitrospinota bacterium]